MKPFDILTKGKHFDILTNGKHSKNIANKICNGCYKKVNFLDFKDELSIKEYTISGFCQQCQNEVFGKD